MVDTVAELEDRYAGAGGVGAMDDIYEGALEALSFFVGVLDYLTLDFEGSFPLDFDLEADLLDLASSFFVLLSLSLLFLLLESLLFSFFMF